MKKILLAIYDDFTRKIYVELFQKERLEVLETNNGKEALNLAIKEIPDIILVDIFLSEIKGFELVGLLRKEAVTQKIPIIIFTQIEKKEDRLKTIELEAKDFIVGTTTPPLDVVLRIKAHLGEQKTYRVLIREEQESVKELLKDLGYSPILKCPRCGSTLLLFLIRDLSKGLNYFKVSFLCPKCG